MRSTATPVAKHQKRGRGFRVPQIDNGIALGALAANDLVSEGGGTATDSDIWLMSIDTVVGLHNLTAGQGPILVGVAHSDYTDAEIEEWVENVTSWTRSDKISEERSRRKIRQIGIFSGVAAEETLNDGKPIRTKCQWALTDGQALNFWAYNSSGAVLTTGGEVDFFGKAYTRKN